MEMIVIPSNKVLTSYINKGIKNFILPIEKFSCDYKDKFSPEEIEEITKKYPKVSIFVVINKPIFNEEIEQLKKVLKRLDKLQIKGILFYDISIIRLKKELSLNVDLVWNNTHMVTNYKTCNYYLEKNVKYGVLSSEITLDEMLEIKNNTKMILMCLVVGYPTIAFSKRKLLSNYYKYYNEESKDNLTVFETVTNDKYKLTESNAGTSFKYGNILNGSSIMRKLVINKFDYAILKEEDIDSNLFLKLVEEFTNYSVDKDVEFISNINSLIGLNTGFFYKKSIYKVKSNEKN